jgi:hypothetical protein
MEGLAVSQAEVEIVPLTDDQVAAIRELRFVWTNLDHTVCWGLTTDQSVAERCPGGVTPVTKSRNPTVVEYDCMMGHPHAVEIVAALQMERAPA